MTPASPPRLSHVVVPVGATYVPLNRRTSRSEAPRLVVFEGREHEIFGDLGTGLQRITLEPALRSFVS